MNTPPKNRTFLADIGYPFYVLAHWNEAMDYYVFAELQVDLYKSSWTDTYFQTDSFKEEELIGWIEKPTLNKEEK